MKIKTGIIFGGFSKEREISFAGGRTVYDNLNKSIFEAIPIFVDSFGNFVLLDWEFIYKGSIRDFYPPVEFIPSGNEKFQLYAENLGELSPAQQEEMISRIGKKIEPENLKPLIDIAFLCLHGPYGEDGRIQGFFEYLGIPYTGSGILPSSIGINKNIQKRLMVNAGFNSPKFMSISRDEYISGNCKGAFEEVKKKIGFPLVVKAANQGSSIGISILHEANEHAFMEAVEKALFTRWLDSAWWAGLTEDAKLEYVKVLTDIREGIGMPVKINETILYNPEHLLAYLDKELPGKEGLVLESLDSESTVLIEGFIAGKEFSCIVIQQEKGQVTALPPTEIRKGKELFDYRSKYLPGLARKITPIDLPREQIEAIRHECERLFRELYFDVYARIDGFITNDNIIYLNDPNTTSGMMPSSFFFHQAAEIGLNPSQFLTYIIRTSLQARAVAAGNNPKWKRLLQELDNSIHHERESKNKKIKIAVLFGGYSSERHISVESGRNIYEKLSSSAKYEPIPVFLTGNDEKHLLYQVPINILLKDNADDIKEKIDHYKVHEVVKEIIEEASQVTHTYSHADNLAKPRLISYDELPSMVDGVFIALHGRPGEDGAVQRILDKLGLPYNGSDADSYNITINKYETNEILKRNGLLVAEHRVVTENEWRSNTEKYVEDLLKQIPFPFIAKPVDDGCSSAVRKIKTREELLAFAELIFRETPLLDQKNAGILKVKLNEEFPQKKQFLVEELISRKNAKHFLEVTGGMLTRFDETGNIRYEIFEASETLVEGEILSLEEKFLAGQGQNITPARYSPVRAERQAISDTVKQQLEKAARALNVTGYCRIDAFVRVFENKETEVIFIEVNSLPGMTPATCIFHQTALNGYKPYDFIDRILQFGFEKVKRKALA
jgi:UDP-N-acetylmuramate--alanine ligase